ncbi:hypothetical protein ACIHAA_02335 [Streptomyces sp. NPDC052040]|uniref:hypothetical protein n=1 Tax=Streptomyces sp. NPDC052040 TaxID=3365682 RepID=UPI0037CFE0A2
MNATAECVLRTYFGGGEQKLVGKPGRLTPEQQSALAVADGTARSGAPPVAPDAAARVIGLLRDQVRAPLAELAHRLHCSES